MFPFNQNCIVNSKFYYRIYSSIERDFMDSFVLQNSGSHYRRVIFFKVVNYKEFSVTQVNVFSRRENSGRKILFVSKDRYVSLDHMCIPGFSSLEQYWLDPTSTVSSVTHFFILHFEMETKGSIAIENWCALVWRMWGRKQLAGIYRKL